jgi:hypothetical protein
LFTGKKELYSAPGDRHFSEEHPAAFTSTGFSQDGLFGMYLYNVLVAGAARYTYRGEEELDGRRAAKYEYRLSALGEPMILSLGGNSKAATGMKGTLWADLVSLDVLRLDVQADEIPPDFPVVSSTAVLHYAPVRIGDRDIMLTQSADSRMELTSGYANRNQVDLTHCRSYEAQSSITFGPPAAEPAAPPPLFTLPGADFAMASQPIPAGLRIAVALSAGVAAKTSVGSPIEGTVIGAAGPKGAKAVIPDGAVVRGRIRRLERQPESGAFLMALEFTDVEVGGARLRFYADLESVDRRPGVECLVTAGGVRSSRAMPQALDVPDLPGVGYLLLGGDPPELPKGFALVWKTRSMIE